uniref:Uncharacterized protein n=1 Tax=Malurus cyaneus samueli TaxID=2593467 RepID=A0A8C5TNM0_9PASS
TIPLTAAPPAQLQPRPGFARTEPNLTRFLTGTQRIPEPLPRGQNDTVTAPFPNLREWETLITFLPKSSNNLMFFFVGLKGRRAISPKGQKRCPGQVIVAHELPERAQYQ